MAELGGQGGGVAADPRGVLRQGRAFLDFFWDIAKPEQEVRLAATENLLRHLKEGRKVRPGPGPAGEAVGAGRHRAGTARSSALTLGNGSVRAPAGRGGLGGGSPAGFGRARAPADPGLFFRTTS